MQCGSARGCRFMACVCVGLRNCFYPECLLRVGFLRCNLGGRLVELAVPGSGRSAGDCCQPWLTRFESSDFQIDLLRFRAWMWCCLAQIFAAWECLVRLLRPMLRGASAELSTTNLLDTLPNQTQTQSAPVFDWLRFDEDQRASIVRHLFKRDWIRPQIAITTKCDN